MRTSISAPPHALSGSTRLIGTGPAMHRAGHDAEPTSLSRIVDVALIQRNGYSSQMPLDLLVLLCFAGMLVATYLLAAGLGKV